MKSVPKGVLHHNHYDCNDAIEFYRKYIANNPIVYVSADKKKFEVGSKKQAEEGKWISMEQLRKEFVNED